MLATADLAPDPSDTLKIRIFRWACLITAGTSFLLMLPLYLVQVPHRSGTIGIVALGLATLVCYWASLRGKQLFLLFFLILLANIDLTWTIDCGAEGGLAFYCLPILLVPLTMYRGAARWALASLVAVNLVGLFLLDKAAPGLLLHFPSQRAQLFDRITGAVCSLVITAAIIRVILKSYDTEHHELEQARNELLLRNAELQDALSNVRQLKGLLPICSGCKKIRDDKNYWHQVDAYISVHTEATFTHGYCPTCLESYFPGAAGRAPQSPA